MATNPATESLEGQTIRVLHVDDDPSFVEVASKLLERQDDRIEVVTETSAADGLDRIAEGGIDCVVSDYDMPRTDGLAFLEAVREDHQDLPFILFTGKGSEEIASEAISAGVTDYIQKQPGSDQYAVLANRIDNAVAQFHTQRRYRTLVENFPEGGVGLYDRNMRYLLVAGPAFDQHGIDTDEWEGKPVAAVHTDGYVERHLSDYHAALDGEHASFEFEYGDRTYRNDTVPVRDEEGEVVAGLSMSRDVTDAKTTERTLERQREAVEAVVGILAEDARPALDAVEAALDPLQDADGDHAESVAGATARLDGAIDRALDAARDATGDRPPD